MADTDVNLRIKVAQQGVENIRRVIADLNAMGAETDDLSAQADRLEEELRGVSDEAGRAGDSARQSAGDYDEAADGAGRLSNQLTQARNALLAYIGVDLGADAVKQVAALADEYAELSARVELATGGGQAYVEAQERIRESANETGAALSATAELYARLAMSSEELALSQQEIAELTDTINKSMIVSGASTAESEGAIRQLTQAMASGVLRGEELNSVLEQSPRLARAIAEGMDVPIGKLREMGQAGELSAERVVNALQSQRKAIEDEFAEMPDTIGRSVQRLQNEWLVFIGELDKSNGVSEKVSGTISTLAENVATIAAAGTTAAQVMGVTFGAKAVASVVGYGRALAAATREAGGLRAAVKRVPTQIVIAASVVGVAKVAKDLQDLRRQHLALDKAERDRAANAERLADRYAEVSERTGVAVSSMEELEAAVEAGRLVWDEASTSWVAAGEALQGTADAADDAAGGIKDKLSAAAKDLLSQFEAIKDESGDVAEAITGIAEAADLTDTDGIEGFAQALEELRDTGEATAEQTADAWNQALESLSSNELANFATNAQAAFGQTEEDAKALAEVLNNALSEAAERAGVNLATAFDGVSDEAAEALDDIHALRELLEATEATAEQTGRALEQAFGAAIDTAQTSADLREIEQRMDRLAAAGELSADAMERMEAALADQRAEIDRATPGIQSMAEAYERVGVTSEQASQKHIQSMRAAYEYIRENGGTVEEQRQAWLAWAEAAVKAGDDAEISQAKAEAAARGTTEQLDELIGKTKEAAEETKKQAEETEKAAEETEKQADAADKAAASTTVLVRTTDSLAESTGLVGEALEDWRRKYRELASEGMVSEEILRRQSESARRYARQMAEARDWADRLRDGTLDATDAAQRAEWTFDALDDEDLSGLRDAIREVRGEMEDLNAAAEETLRSLREELAEAQGDYQTAEQLRAQERIREIEEQIAEARRLGADEAVRKLEESLRLQQELNDAALREAEIRERDARRPSAPSGGGGGSTVPSGGGGTISPTINIQGVLDVNDRATLDGLARKLGPVFDDLQRRGAR